MGYRNRRVWAAADRVMVTTQGVLTEHFYCSAWCLMNTEWVKASGCRKGSVSISIDVGAPVLPGTRCNYCGAVCSAEYVKPKPR